MSQSRGKSSALIVRAALVIGLCLVLGEMMLRPSSAIGQPGGSAPDQGGYHTEDMRNDDQLTSATLVMAALAKKPLGEGMIDFRMLRSTRLYRKPPPVFREDLLALDGKRVKMHGFMAPYDKLDDMRLFMLMPTPTGCQFCIPPSPKEVVYVRWPGEDKREFIFDAIEVEGTLKLWKEGSEDTAHRSFLFVLDEAKLRTLSLEDVKSN